MPFIGVVRVKLFQLTGEMGSTVPTCRGCSSARPRGEHERGCLSGSKSIVAAQMPAPKAFGAGALPLISPSGLTRRNFSRTSVPVTTDCVRLRNAVFVFVTQPIMFAVIGRKGMMGTQ